MWTTSWWLSFGDLLLQQPFGFVGMEWHGSVTAGNIAIGLQHHPPIVGPTAATLHHVDGFVRAAQETLGLRGSSKLQVLISSVVAYPHNINVVGLHIHCSRATFQHFVAALP